MGRKSGVGGKERLGSKELTQLKAFLRVKLSFLRVWQFQMSDQLPKFRFGFEPGMGNGNDMASCFAVGTYLCIGSHILSL
jgi:hypothetical protein